MKVIGITRKTGVYKEVPYDNTFLYCTYNAKDVDGEATMIVKIKTKNLGKVYVGDSIDCLYDRYGNTVAVNVLAKA